MFVVLQPPQQQQLRDDWFHHWYADPTQQRLVSSVARCEGGFLLRYPDLADFRISCGLSHLTIYPVPGVRQNSLRHLLLDSALPHVLGQQGDVILHASAVCSSSGRGIAFAGDSGWGKSTLAAGLQDRGFNLISDDCLKLSVSDKTLFGQAAYAGARLWPDAIDRLFPGRDGGERVMHSSPKQRIALSHAANDRPVELHHLVLVQPPLGEKERITKDVSLSPRSDAKILTDLIARCYLLDLENRQAVSHQFRSMGTVVSTGIQIWSLDFLRSFDQFQRLLDVVSALGESG